MNALTIFAALLFTAALLYLGVVLRRRYPTQPHEPGSWRAPADTARWAGREPGFDRTVDRIEAAKGTRRDWQALLSHLDAIADELDPTPTSGSRRVVPFRRGARFWVTLDSSGAPQTYNRNYLDDRLTAIEQRNGGTPRG
jgi:hypothetical protein